MYPFVRLAWQFWLHRKSPALPPRGIHISRHMCMPWDLDMWWELNNGRTLTIYDLGRLPLAGRVGLIKVLKANKWGLTMAGASVRYRRRVRMFDVVEMHSRAVGWDDKFIYLEQSMWKDGECTSHILYRSAVTSKSGMVPPRQVMAALGMGAPEHTSLPDWVQAWVDAEMTRPWPPVMVE